MYWLLLPVAALFLFLGLRTPSAPLMLLFFLLMLGCIAAWVWLRYQELFPSKRPPVLLTPLDKQELERLRQQRQQQADAPGTGGVAPVPAAPGNPFPAPPVNVAAHTAASAPANPFPTPPVNTAPHAPAAAAVQPFPTPVPPPQPVAPPVPAPAPAAATPAAPITGRAVFTLPDDPPRPVNGSRE